MIRIGSISMSRAEMTTIMTVLNDPELRDRAVRHYAATHGVSLDVAREDMDWFDDTMQLVEKEANGTATAEERRVLETRSRDPRFDQARDSVEYVANDTGLHQEAARLANTDVDQATAVVRDAPTIQGDHIASQAVSTETREAVLEAQDYTSEEIAELADRRAGRSTTSRFGDDREGPIISARFDDAADATHTADAQPTADTPAPQQRFGLDA